MAIFFPRVILYTFFSYFYSFIVVWGFGVGVLDKVLRLGFSVDGVWSLWCRAFWILWVGAFYINIKALPWEKRVRS